MKANQQQASNGQVISKKVAVAEFEGKTQEQWRAEANIYGNKSNVIRQLFSLKMEKADIARLLDCRYQQVRNTLERPLKKAE